MNSSQTIGTESLDIWDDIVNEPVHASVNAAQQAVAAPAPAPGAPVSALAPASNVSHRLLSLAIGPIPIEDQLLSLPSNGNVGPVHRDLECSHYIALAQHHLNQIHNLIAEKSFQFSHIIHISPHKGVTTRSRAAVKKLDLQIALHCQLYTRCQTHFVALDADQPTQAR
ncbi:hypothetical protein BYT27DRAFT_7116145 [Phlegmacium glaucopus]|nr:hypothetical protein BYT27DRAFT_7116145 [Phlegmacium glaucopus]